MLCTPPNLAAASFLWQQPTLELVEIRAHQLPPKHALGGATISADGNRILAWSVDRAELLVYDQAAGPPRRLPGPHHVAGAAFGDSTSIAVLHPDGTMSVLSMDGSVASAGRVFPASSRVRADATAGGGVVRFTAGRDLSRVTGQMTISVS